MKDKKVKSKNKYIEGIKQLSKSKRGRAILFFLFYFIFFFILISLLRSGYNSKEKIEDKNNYVNIEYKLDKIEEGNYHFTREETINGILTKFSGDKSNNKIKGIMTLNDSYNNYFIYDNINLIKLTDKYEITNDLYHFNNITDDQNIAKILNQATLISKTEYETGNISYNYQITTNTIDKILNNTNLDIADIPNNIILETNNLNEVTKITYDLTSYATYLNKVSTTVEISMNYSNFNEIGNIEIPEN